jgi:hypothetical protein
MGVAMDGMDNDDNIIPKLHLQKILSSCAYSLNDGIHMNCWDASIDVNC